MYPKLRQTNNSSLLEGRRDNSQLNRCIQYTRRRFQDSLRSKEPLNAWRLVYTTARIEQSTRLNDMMTMTRITSQRWQITWGSASVIVTLPIRPENNNTFPPCLPEVVRLKLNSRVRRDVVTTNFHENASPVVPSCPELAFQAHIDSIKKYNWHPFLNCSPTYWIPIPLTTLYIWPKHTSLTSGNLWVLLQPSNGNHFGEKRFVFAHCTTNSK